MEIRKSVQYATHDGTALSGDLYLPDRRQNGPAIVAVHGGGWQVGSRDIYQYMAPYLAQHGYTVFSIDYRLVVDGKNRYPAAVNDVRAAVQWLRSQAEALTIDPSRIGLIGDSAGAHLASLVALSGDVADQTPDDSYSSLSTKVKTVVGVYGVYDLIAQWQHDLAARPVDNITQNFLGFPPMQDRVAWHAASPLTHATFANNSTAFLLVWGTQDDIVDPSSQSEAFLLALKQARFFVRTVVVQSAPHFWMADPVEEANSFAGFLAPRLLRFLAERL